jgi:hypothetical protein
MAAGWAGSGLAWGDFADGAASRGRRRIACRSGLARLADRRIRPRVGITPRRVGRIVSRRLDRMPPAWRIVFRRLFLITAPSRACHGTRSEDREIFQQRQNADDDDNHSHDLSRPAVDRQHVDQIEDENDDQERNENADQD